MKKSPKDFVADLELAISISNTAGSKADMFLEVVKKAMAQAYSEGLGDGVVHSQDCYAADMYSDETPETPKNPYV